MHPDQLLKLEKEVYGTVLGTAKWRETLVEDIMNLGYRQCSLEPCAFTLVLDKQRRGPIKQKKVYPFPDTDWLEPTMVDDFDDIDIKLEASAGRILLQVDDVLESGDEHHRKRMNVLDKKYKFGQDDLLTKKTGTTFNGRRLFQDKRGTIHVSMADYVDKVHEISLEKERKKNAQDAVNESERTKLRGLNQSVMWLARQERPDVMGSSAVTARRIMEATIQDIVEMNKVVQHLKKTKHLCLQFACIHPRDVRFVAIADASPYTKGETHGQGATIIGITDEKLEIGEREREHL